MFSRTQIVYLAKNVVKRILPRSNLLIRLHFGLAVMPWLLGATLVLQEAYAQAAQIDQRSNIILIMVDDLRADDLPQLSQVNSLLVQKGLNFTQFFTPNALCCPSRISTLRGQFSHNHGIWTNFQTSDGGFLSALRTGLQQETIAVWLQRAGYETALFGKYLNDYGKEDRGTSTATYIPPGWTRWFGALSKPGDYYSGYNYFVNDDGLVRQFGARPADYLTDVLAAEAKSFIITARQHPVRKPLFLYVAPTAPHKSIPPAPRHQPNVFDTFTPVPPPNFNEADVSDKPSWIQAIAPLTRKELEDVTSETRRRLGSMLAVEDLLEDVIYAVEQIGELDNTYIFFVSDNGLHLGEHRLQSKATVYDAAVRVPLVVRGPGVAANQALGHMVYNHDLTATFAQIAGAQTPEFLDGKSLVPLFANAGRPRTFDWRTAILLEHREQKGGERPKFIDRDRIPGGAVQPEVFSVITPDYQYVEYVDSVNGCELYRLGRLQDPFRLNNLCARAPYAPAQAALQARLRALQSCQAATCRTLEMQPFPPGLVPNGR